MSQLQNNEEEISLSYVARRLYKELELLNVFIEISNYIQAGDKISMPRHAQHGGPHHQFSIEKFTVKYIEELALRISQVSKSIKFCQLILPKQVDFAAHCQYRSLIFRYLENYEAGTNKLFKRLDVLIIKS